MREKYCVENTDEQRASPWYTKTQKSKYFHDPRATSAQGGFWTLNLQILTSIQPSTDVESPRTGCPQFAIWRVWGIYTRTGPKGVDRINNFRSVESSRRCYMSRSCRGATQASWRHQAGSVWSEERIRYVQMVRVRVGPGLGCVDADMHFVKIFDVHTCPQDQNQFFLVQFL